MKDILREALDEYLNNTYNGIYADASSENHSRRSFLSLV
jgi:hypothetical protein